MEDEVALNGLILATLDRHEDRKAAIDEIYQQLENADLISKVTVHRYLCTRGCNVRATVIRVGALTLIRTEDYKFSAGYNEANSVDSARKKRTLDGQRWWPKHTLDVADLAEMGGAAQIQVPCRHRVLLVNPVDLMEQVSDVRPGRPGPPTRL